MFDKLYYVVKDCIRVNGYLGTYYLLKSALYSIYEASKVKIFTNSDSKNNPFIDFIKDFLKLVGGTATITLLMRNIALRVLSRLFYMALLSFVAAFIVT